MRISKLGISTISQVTNLRMALNDEEKLYLIKEILPRGYSNKIIITINSFDSENYEFNIDVEYYS